jgi:DNA mismatch repair protein MutS
LLSEAPTVGAAGGQGEDRSCARDLNLDQIVAAVAGDREERDLITTVLFRRLHDAAAVRYRQEVFQDLEDPALLDAFRRFSRLMSEVQAHLRQLDQMPYRHQREGWFLDAAAVYCQAVASLAEYLASAQPGSRALRDFRDYLVSYAASASFTTLASDTEDRKDALGRIRYCTRIRGDRVEVSRYAGEADYSAAVLKTFERFKQGATRDYLIRYRTWPGMNHVAAQITGLVARLFPDEFTALEEYCRQHAGFGDEGIRRAAAELQFYLAYLDYIEPVRAAGLRFCYPEVSASSKEIRAADTFDLALAHKLAERKPAARSCPTSPTGASTWSPRERRSPSPTRHRCHRPRSPAPTCATPAWNSGHRTPSWATTCRPPGSRWSSSPVPTPAGNLRSCAAPGWHSS